MARRDPLSPILRASDGFLSDLDRQAAPVVKQVLARYDRIQPRLAEAVRALEAQAAEIDPAGRAQLYQLSRYQTLLQQVNEEIGRLGGAVADAAERASDQAAVTGAEAGAELVRLQANTPGIAGAFTRMDPRTVARAASFVGEGSPLTEMLRGQYGQGWAQVIAQQYVTGVALGQSPRTVARNLARTIDVALPADLDRIIRTAQLWSYRAANHEAWRRSGVTEGWTWSSALDSRTCGACWAMHGTFHSEDETLNDHHRGRCAAIPRIKPTLDYTPTALDVPTGEAEFARLSRGEQDRVASAGGWAPHLRAYREGAIEFGQMATTRRDAIYGDMRVQPGLKSIIGEEAAQFYA